MDDAQLQRIEQWYHDYVDRFRGDAWRPMHEMKYRHCLRVSANAAAIAKGQGWPDIQIRTARALGLLHDAGRFSQFAEFGTFYDPDSCNHAHRSFDVITAEGVLADLPADDRDAIAQAVRLHNVRAVPDDLAAEIAHMLRALRDADKIDIIKVVGDAVDADDREQLDDMVWGLDLHGPVNDDLIRAIGSRQEFCYTKLASLADTLLLHLSWVWSICYPAAMRLIANRSVIERIGRQLPDTPDIATIVAKAVDYRDQMLTDLQTQS